ncbi:MAG: hypothetical protein IJH84_08575, partial [Saccharopolyspora sp.]|uniref:hypothetical protein n=1 Tax=Saccharopolyspora sp. TaxID=33915 RepID=UPI0025CF252F
MEPIQKVAVDGELAACSSPCALLVFHLYGPCIFDHLPITRLFKRRRHTMSIIKTAAQRNTLTLSTSSQPLAEHGVHTASGVRISGDDRGVRISAERGVRISARAGVRISATERGVRISGAERGVRISSRAGVRISAAAGVRISGEQRGVRISGRSGVRISAIERGVRISSAERGVRISGQHGVRISGAQRGVRISGQAGVGILGQAGVRISGQEHRASVVDQRTGVRIS